MARRRAKLSDLLNDLTFKTLHDKYRLMCMNLFEWEGLPEGIEPRHLEAYLFDYGKAAFFRDPKMSYMCLQCSEGGGRNVYGDPTSWRVTGFNYNREYTADDVVIIDNNILRIPTNNAVMFYVNKLTEAERTMDVNIKSCKTPIIFAVEDKTVLSFKQIYSEVDGNTPAIFADKSLNLDAITAFDTKVKFMGNELLDYSRTVESNLLTFLGVNNTPIDKKERLITSEAESNDQLISSFFELQMEARSRAVEAINEKFGLNISVKPRQPSVNNSVETVEGGNDDAQSV